MNKLKRIERTDDLRYEPMLYTIALGAGKTNSNRKTPRYKFQGKYYLHLVFSFTLRL